MFYKVNVTTFYVTEVFASLLRFFQPAESTSARFPIPSGSAAAAALQLPPFSWVARGAEEFCSFGISA